MKNKIEMNRNAITLEEGFEQWIMNCKRRGFTEGTIKYYHYMSDIFMNIIPYKTELSSINSDVIDKFITALQDKEIKTTTINSYLNGIRAICNFWTSKEYIKRITIKKIKCDEVIKETFNENEIKIILKKPNLKICTFLEYEKWVLCNTFYGLGARASTIAGLKIEDIDLENKYVFYRKVKDRKQTIIPLGDTLTNILKEFLVYRKGQTDDYLFCNSFGGKLNKDSINSMLNKYYKSRGVSKTGVHIWRRTFAKDYIINGGNALKLQAQLCHKTLDMTKRYVALYGKDIRDDSHNPLENISKSKHIKLEK